MQLDDFWSIIETARTGADDPDDTAARVHADLAQRPADEIYSYLEHQASQMERSYTWALWGAAYVANGGCSDDGFDYFRGWLLAQGRAAFDRVVADPDALADLVDDQDEAECEDMIGAASLAYKDVTGAYPDGPPTMLPELGDGWDFDDADEMVRRYPRLSEKLG